MSIPIEMTAIEITKPGGPEVLHAVRRPVPRPGNGEVLIRVEAAGVLRAELRIGTSLALTLVMARGVAWGTHPAGAPPDRTAPSPCRTGRRSRAGVAEEDV